MRASWLRAIVGGSAGEITRHLGRFVQTGLVTVFDGRHYPSELGMRRAANMSWVLPSVSRRRHGAYLDRWYGEHEERHNDGVNRLVVRFAREGVEAVAGWRGEMNVPSLTQVRPDLLVRVSDGALGTDAYCIEFERSAVAPQEVNLKLGSYRRMAAAGRPLPLLMVCETVRGEVNFRAAGGMLPMLTATLEGALAGPLPGQSRCGAGTAFRPRSTAGVDGNQVRRRLTGDTPLIAPHRSPLAATGPQVIPLCTSGIPVLATPLGKGHIRGIRMYQ